MSIEIPVEALNTHIGILGRTGSGKTFTARGQVERLIDDRRQVVIVDPTGAWWGLRSTYPIPIFGGAHGDVAITEESGEAVARTIIDHGTSAIIDLSLLARQSGAAMRRFMRSFIARLKDKPNGAIWLVIDEADEFLPQVLPNGMETLFGDLKWLVRRGRVAGWRVMMITQRPQDIAKSVLTQVGTLIAHRLTAPQDRKAVEEWVKGHADPEVAKQVLSSLAGLATGEAWVWWPDGGLLERGIMPPISSFDSSATPDAGSGKIEQPPLTAIDMAAIQATLENGRALNELPAATVLDETLKRRIADLEAERDEAIRSLREVSAELLLTSDALDCVTELLGRAGKIIKSIPSRSFTEVEVVGSEVEDKPCPTNAAGGRYAPAGNDVVGSRATSQSGSIARPGPTRDTPTTSTPGLNAAARKMIEMLDRIAPARVPWGSLAAMVGNKARGGNFNSARKAMRESGLIVEDGDTVRSATQPAQGMTREEAFELWSSVLSNPAPRMMEALRTVDGATKAQIGQMLGIVPRGGNFNNGIAQLIRNGIAIDRGGVLHLANPLPGESGVAGLLGGPEV